MSLAGVETGEKMLVCGDRSELAMATFVAEMETLGKVAHANRLDPKYQCICRRSKRYPREQSPPRCNIPARWRTLCLRRFRLPTTDRVETEMAGTL